MYRKDFAGSEVDWRSRGGTIGLRVGAEAPMTPRLAFLPWAGVSVAQRRQRATSSEYACATSETYGAVALGTSLLLGRRVALTPTVSQPVGLENGTANLGVSVTLGLGRR
jgi:hypothetical protein